MSKTSRDKGKRFELEIVRMAKGFHPDVKRNLSQFQRSDGRDLDNTEPYCIQLKRRKKVGINDVNTGFSEAVNSADDRYWCPVCITRSDGEEAMVHMLARHWFEIECLMEDGEL